MTAREIVDKWVAGVLPGDDKAIKEAVTRITDGLCVDIEQAVAAAVETDRKQRPHEFVGRLDRWCEVCGEPDRDARHLFSTEVRSDNQASER